MPRIQAEQAQPAELIARGDGFAEGYTPLIHAHAIMICVTPALQGHLSRRESEFPLVELAAGTLVKHRRRADCGGAAKGEFPVHREDTCSETVRSDKRGKENRLERRQPASQ